MAPHLDRSPGHDQPPPGSGRRDERRHEAAPMEEWWFSCWGADGSFGLVWCHRITPAGGWYWSALARVGEPLLHATEWPVTPRSDPLLVKAPEMWAEASCVAPFDQWTIGNELYAAALDDPDEALGRAYGAPTPFAMDLEWYATVPAVAVEHGYTQGGVVHGLVELPSGPVELEEVPAARWHRWGTSLGPVPLPLAVAHLGLRAPARLPDGTTVDLVLTPAGWSRRP